MAQALYSLDDDAVPGRIGEYDILSRVGSGGMGVVYEGRQPAIGKRVAVKVLNAEASDDAEMVERFVGEARAVNEIRHRGIVDIFSFGTLDDGRHYLVMELLEGRSFEQVLREEGRVDATRVLDWSIQVLEAMGAAHEAGVVHRDIKPSNLFLCEHRRFGTWVKLLDFGIAKLIRGGSQRTRAAMIIGTPDYMSPEQIRSAGVTPASDLYALGCVMFQLLAGRRPFEGRSSVETMAMHLESPLPGLLGVVPGVTRDLDDLVRWLMDKDPSKRPGSAEVAFERAHVVREQYPSRKTPTPMPRTRESIETVHARPSAPRELAAPTVVGMPAMDPAPATQIHVRAELPDGRRLTPAREQQKIATLVAAKTTRETPRADVPRPSPTLKVVRAAALPSAPRELPQAPPTLELPRYMTEPAVPRRRARPVFAGLLLLAAACCGLSELAAREPERVAQLAPALADACVQLDTR